MLEVNEHLVRAALLRYAEDTWDWDNWGEFINYHSHVPGTVFDVPGLGQVTMVDFHSYDHNKSYDGWTEELWIVFEVDGKLWKIKGRHTSYTGSEWDDKMVQVKPVEKTVIEYGEVV